jgi:RNA polymerase sigma-70 factor (ECF subfamily)
MDRNGADGGHPHQLRAGDDDQSRPVRSGYTKLQHGGAKAAAMPARTRYADVIEWISCCILPHEAALRGWLQRHAAMDADDLVQEAYCRLSQLSDWETIANPRAYLFTTVRNLLLEHVRRSQVVGIQSLLDIQSLDVVDTAPLPDQIVEGQTELGRLRAIAEHLPDNCRDVFILRKLYQLSQREVAERLDLTQSVVEKRTAQALKIVLRAWTRPLRTEPLPLPDTHARHRQ